MDKDLEILIFADVFIKENKPIREVAKILGIGKTTLHKKLTHDLPKINMVKYKRVRKILDKNKKDGWVKGGKAAGKIAANHKKHL